MSFFTGQTAPAAGIGLTIVKAIVQAHGGRVSVNSQQSKGTCVTIVLPKMQQKAILRQPLYDEK